MSTINQLEANRLNAQQSTGPRTPEGKAVSRFNAMKHGIDARSLVIPGEDLEELAALAGDYVRQFLPDGPVEQHLVRTIIQSDWYLRRYDRIEAAIITRTVGSADPDIAVPDLFANNTRTNPLPHLFRRRQAAQRDWFRALKELQRLQKERKEAAEAESAAAAAKPTPIGFDLQKKPASSPAPAKPEKIAG